MSRSKAIGSVGWVAGGAVAAALSGLVGCSSDTTINQSGCGPGTALTDGVCVAAKDSSTDTAELDASVADTSSETSSDARSDDSAYTQTESATPDAVLDTDAAADAMPAGDACPTSALAIDCSGECGKPVSAECSSLSCFEPSILTEYPHYVIDNLSKLPMVIRTPNHPGVDPKCQPRCGTGNTAYGIGFKLNVPGVPADGIRVRVAPPWQIYWYDPYHPHCMAVEHPAYSKGNCFFDPLTKGRFDFLVTTTDPSAPARNITVEHVAPGGPRCDGL